MLDMQVGFANCMVYTFLLGWAPSKNPRKLLPQRQETVKPPQAVVSRSAHI